MKKTHLLLAAGLAVGLAGCATGDKQELTQKTVEYACGAGGEQPLTVQYTFRGEEAVSARVVHMNQAVDMMRVTAANADMVGNTFRGGGYTWVTGKFDRDDVDEVDGNMLTMDSAPAGAYGAAPHGAAAHGGAPYGAATAPHGGYAAGGAPGSYPPAAHGGYAPPQGAMAATGQPGQLGTVLVRDCRVS